MSSLTKFLNKDPVYRLNINEIICHPLIRESVISHIESKGFKDEYLRIAKYIKKKPSETKEEEKESEKSSKLGLQLYKEYVKKIKELIDSTE